MADKVRGGMAKHLLKKAVDGLIPDEIIYRKKMGFGAPMAQWLRGDFGERVENAILSSRLIGARLVRSRTTSAAVRRASHGPARQ